MTHLHYFPGPACTYPALFAPPHTLPAATPWRVLHTPNQDPWPVPAGTVRYWTRYPHPRPWAPRPMPLFCISWQDFLRDYDVAAPLRGRRDGRGGSFNCDGCRPGIVTQQPCACPLRCLVPVLGFGGRRRRRHLGKFLAGALVIPLNKRVITTETCLLSPPWPLSRTNRCPFSLQWLSRDRTSAESSRLTNPSTFFAGVGHATITTPRPQAYPVPWSGCGRSIPEGESHQAEELGARG